MKRIVVCCDGTWNNDDLQSNDTNVALLARAIHGSRTADGTPQIVLYLRGVGTTGLKFETVIAGAIGLGVDDNIRSAYQFIAQNYLPGDEIYLFGFSRGAFTVRSLAGLITACGILYRQSLGALPDAWAYYRTPRPHDPAKFAASCNARTHADATVHFLGVWDTVGSMGIPGQLMADANKQQFAFHDTSPSPIVRHGVHALALDEHRHNFIPTFWTGTAAPNTTIEQVWFAGVHADVGGGYRTRGLADIPLVWMARRAEADGLAFDWTCLPDPTQLDPLAPAHDSSCGLFTLDHFRPTLREVGGRPCGVALNESLYEALNEHGHRVATIGEAVHRSVIQRYGQSAQLCANDDHGTCRTTPYSPKTLQPFYTQGTFAGLHIAD